MTKANPNSEQWATAAWTFSQTYKRMGVDFGTNLYFYKKDSANLYLFLFVKLSMAFFLAITFDPQRFPTPGTGTVPSP